MYHPLLTLDAMFFMFVGFAILGLLWFRKQSSVTTLGRAGSKVSAAYWGTYKSNDKPITNPRKLASFESGITLPKINPIPQIVIAGSNKYSKGKPVKTLRS